MLKELLEQKKCFKLICGAGNENLQEVERLIALYAKAGCHFFDLSANEEVLKAAQRGLDFAIPKDEQKDYHFCISIGTIGDQHVQKARIDSEKCVGCGKCIEICPQKAISAKCKVQSAKYRGGLLSHRYEIIEKNCIGCNKCLEICQHNAIEMQYNTNATPLRLLSSTRLSCIELHANDANESEVDEIWNELQNFDGVLSLCIGRGKLGNEQIISRIKRLIKNRKPYTTIIQADGAPMSGGEDDFKTTLQAVAMAEVIQNENLPVYLMLSGGTNSKTAELAKLCKVDFNGISVGSYARKIVKEYIELDEFFEDECFEQALKAAKNLVNNMGFHPHPNF